jgi:hypothetical protein
VCALHKFNLSIDLEILLDENFDQIYDDLEFDKVIARNEEIANLGTSPKVVMQKRCFSNADIE